ncbi:MAG: hypothetical protein A3A26_01935 [Candidatus Zambryskibacteria bacterium RIFCSPLOWO2_01_FULL_47_14]|uniref:DUF1508 domain-containing protein n=1 Tax=Candidatus Zambryskibacteria bacterium RIFCSPLOWO2_01_FULL_47_14 TaxID=1802763 RepID=A0A1G2U797_9BACT|nr:MAG: hypothetical protein A3A26_01935 [Candidatus Zambryskibacteria bacterium RIFCSPLOWO2_01_FULL_47_14]
MPLPKKVQVFKGQDGDARVRMVFKNNRKMNVSEGYENTTYARKVGNEIGNALGIKVDDLTKKK